MSTKTNKSDIRVDRNTLEVVVVDENGIEIFRKPKTEQYVSIANAVYMCHKYKSKSN